MKRTIFYIMLALLSLNTTKGIAQAPLPSANVLNVNGGRKDITSYIADEGLTMICFWRTCCKTNTDFLNELHEICLEEGDNIQLKIVIISVDDIRSSARVKPFVYSMGWEFETLIDDNSELKRLLNAGDPPYLFLVNNKKQIIYKQKIISPSDAFELMDKIKNNKFD